MNTGLKFFREFIFDPHSGIYKHPEGMMINYQDGGESYIFESMKKIKNLSSDSEEFQQYIKDWQSRYHFSHKRVNFLEAIHMVLPKDADVLEIGSGCGTITRWLGEKFRTVDALEGSLHRATITRYRTHDLDNVRVYCGDVLTTAFERKYDLITLIGSLEYLPLYDIEHDDPKEACSAILNRLRNTLKENGILLIAMENKFGTKYFSGCKEDHTGREFEGLMGYPEKTPITFSRNELDSMLYQSGFEYNQFYHVFPDYKLSETIIPENSEVLSLRPYNWIRTPFEDYFGIRDYLFHEFLFLRNVTNSDLLWQFSNSFIILATISNTNDLRVPWLIKKYHCNNYLDSRFNHEITLTKNEKFTSPHDCYIVKRDPIFRGVPNYSDNSYEYALENNNFVQGKILISFIYENVMKKKSDQPVIQELHLLHENLISQYKTGTNDDEGYPCIKGEAIDFTFWNLILTSDNRICFIDCKWRSKNVITADYILFRNLFAVYDWINPFIKKIPKSDFIIGLIQQIYPQYTYARLQENVRLEEIFQSFASGMPIRVHIDEKTHPLFNYRYEKIKQLISEIEVLRSHYEAMAAERNDRDTRIKQLTAYTEELQLHYNAMAAERNAIVAERNDRDAQIKQLTYEFDDLKNYFLVRIAIKLHKILENAFHFKQQG